MVSVILLAVQVTLSVGSAGHFVGSSTVSHPHKRRPVTAVSCYLLSSLSWPAAGHLPKPHFFMSTCSFCMLHCSVPTTVPEAAPPPHTHTHLHTYTCTHTHSCTHPHPQTCMHTHTHSHVHARAHTHTHTYLCPHPTPFSLALQPHRALKALPPIVMVTQAFHLITMFYCVNWWNAHCKDLSLIPAFKWM